MTMENPPFEDVFPIEHWDFQCHVSFLRDVYISLADSSPVFLRFSGKVQLQVHLTKLTALQEKHRYPEGPKEVGPILVEMRWITVGAMFFSTQHW